MGEGVGVGWGGAFQRGICCYFCLEAGLPGMPGSRPPPQALHQGTDCLSSGVVFCTSCRAVRSGDSGMLGGEGSLAIGRERRRMQP